MIRRREESRKGGFSKRESYLATMSIFSSVVINTWVYDSLAGIDLPRPSLRGPRLIGDQDLLMVPRRLSTETQLRAPETRVEGDL